MPLANLKIIPRLEELLVDPKTRDRSHLEAAAAHGVIRMNELHKNEENGIARHLPSQFQCKHLIFSNI